MDTEHPTMPYPGPPAGDDDPTPPARGDGETWIADSIVAKVAASAAREVDGVASLRGGIPRRGLIRGSERRRGGAMVQVDDGAVAVSVRLVVLEGFAIPRIIETVRERIMERIAFATGMTVTHVDIGVVDVVPRPSPSAPSQTAPPAPA
jgi:uncharacterized alkaline shock family protein YloU